MAIFAHGCTASAFAAIMEKKGKDNCPAPWAPSDRDGLTYLYSLDKFEESGEGNQDTMISRAFEQAELQALFNDDQEVFVVLLDIAKELTEDDYSCPNMDGLASCLPCEVFSSLSFLKVYKRGISQWDKPVILSLVAQNPHFSKYLLDEKLINLANDLYKSGEYFEYEPEDWVEVTL